MNHVFKWGHEMEGHHGNGNKYKINWEMVAAAFLMWMEIRISYIKVGYLSQRSNSQFRVLHLPGQMIFTLVTLFRREYEEILILYFE